MVKVNALLALSAPVYLASAMPLERRIAQETSAAKTAWEAACNTAGGGASCNEIAVVAAGTLLSGAGVCDQQNSADAMIDLAKQLNDDSEMIRLAQLFVQQPRNAGDSLQVPYCQVAPKNVELNGLFHCQFAGSKFPEFSGDQTGNVPLGLNAPVNPAGSCPAKPDGPVPDGVQLNTLVQDPGVGGAVGSSDNNSTAANSGTEGENNTVVDDDDCDNDASNSGGSSSTSGDNGATGGAAGNSPSTASTASGDFKKQNGLDAQELNQKFASLTADSACTDGEAACVGNSFAQCVGGQFALTNCGGGTICAALPLVNSAGTSITCTTAGDRDARIAAAIGA